MRRHLSKIKSEKRTKGARAGSLVLLACLFVCLLVYFLVRLLLPVYVRPLGQSKHGQHPGLPSRALLLLLSLPWQRRLHPTLCLSHSVSPSRQTDRAVLFATTGPLHVPHTHHRPPPLTSHPRQDSSCSTHRLLSAFAPPPSWATRASDTPSWAHRTRTSSHTHVP